MSEHIVKQGEHLVGIAAGYGFLDYKKIWGNSHNAELKKLRKNPNILFPGDRIFIPELDANTLDIATEQRHKFKVKKTLLSIRIVIRNVANKPIVDTECEVKIDGEKFSHITDSDGKIEQPISNKAKKGTLTIFNNQYDLLIGNLDPITEVSGQKERLGNLGYFFDTNDKEINQKLLSAIEEFQCDNKLNVDGICGPKTQGRLVEVHGC